LIMQSLHFCATIPLKKYEEAQHMFPEDC
jgi:hypothetical protein